MISPAALRRVVDAALTAPSGDNCQPFRYRWDGEALTIRHDADRAHHRMNVGNHASLLTLGCVLEAIDLAASAEQLLPRFELLPGLGGPQPDWAVARFTVGVRQRDPLLGALWDRATDRRPYRGGRLDDPVFRQLLATRDDQVTLHLAQRPTRDLLAFMLKVDEVIWRDEETAHDALAWVRYTDEDVRRTRDGMSWRNIGITWPEAQASQLIARFPGMLGVVRRAGAMQATKLALRRQLRSAAGLILVTADAPGFDALIAAGRAMFRAWLHLTGAGYTAQPLSLASLCVYNHLTRVLPDDLPGDLVRTFASGRDVLARAFGFEPARVPVWMLRTGRADPLPPVARALRLRREDVLDVVSARA